MKNIRIIIFSILVLFSPLFAYAVNITVPAAAGNGYMLVSTSTGNYIATTTDPIHAGSFYATSSIASWLPYASTTAATFTNASTTNLVISGIGGSIQCLHVSSSGVVTGTGSDCGSGGSSFAYPFTPTTAFGTAMSGTTTAILDYPGFVGATSTIGTFTATSSITNLSVKSALVLNSAAGLEGAYAGASNPCTNQVPTTISAVGALGGCASINNAWWSGTVLSVANGGTGLASPGSGAASAILEFNGSSGVPTILQAGAQYTVLQSTAGGGGFTADAVHLDQSAAVTGILPVTNGGSGAANFNKYPIVGGGGTNALSASSTLWVVGINATGTVASTFGVSSTTYGSFIDASSTRYHGANLDAGCTGSNFLQVSNGVFQCAASGSLSGGTAGMLAAWTGASTQNATSGPTFNYFTGTSTTATSSLGGLIWFTPDPKVGRALYIGTSTNQTPIYGLVQGGLDYEYNFNGNTGWNVVNDNSGSCASEGYWADGNIPALNSNYAFFGFLNVGWTGSGCAMGNGLESPLDTIITNPTGGTDLEMASTTQVKFQIYGKNNVKVFSVTNDTGVASTTNLILSGLGGTGTRCMQVGADGTVTANASACGTGGSAGAQSSSTVQFVIYPSDQTSNPAQYFLYNASSTAVVQSASFTTLLKRAYSSLGFGGNYSGTAQGTGPGGAIYLTPGTFYTNATTTCNGNEQFSTGNAPRCEVFGAGQDATKVVVVAGADGFAYDHGAIPSLHDMAIYTTGFEKALVATSSNPNIRSIWQFDYHNISFESTTTGATTTAVYLGNVLRGQMYNLDFYGQNVCMQFFAEGNFNVGGATVTRTFCDLGTAQNGSDFLFTQNSTGFVNEIEGYYNEGIGRTGTSTYIKSTGLAFSHFNDSSAEQFSVLVDGLAGTISNRFDFAYSIDLTGGGTFNNRGCRFWGGSYDNQCNFQNGNQDVTMATIDDMNSNTDFPNRISGTINQSAGTGSASSTAVANYQIINFHGTGTWDTNFKPDTDWAGYQIWSKVIAKSYKAFLSGANAAAGLYVDINTSIATNVGLFINDETNFAHAGDFIRLVMKNASDSANGLDIQNLGTGNSIIATSSRGTDFVVTGLKGFTGVGTTTPWGLMSILPNGVPDGRPAFVIGSTSATYFLVNNGGNIAAGSSTPFAFFSINPNNIGNKPLFVIGSSSVTNLLVKSANVAAMIVGSSTAPTSPTNIAGFFVNEPNAGSYASTTLMIGDPSTTTSRSQISFNNSAGTAGCLDVRGTVVTWTAGACP